MRPCRAFSIASLASFVLLLGLVRPDAGLTHPHDPNDPLAFAPSDTIAAGDRTLLPMRAGAERWRCWKRDSASDVPGGWIEQQIVRLDSEAGRRWIVAITRTAEDGRVESRDSIWFTGDGDRAAFQTSQRGSRSLELSFDGPSVSGKARQSDDTQPLEARLRLGAFPDGVRRLLFARLPLAEGYATEIATFDPWALIVAAGHGYVEAMSLAERRVAVRVSGEARLRVAGKERRCWKLLVLDRDTTGASHAVWIDRRSRQLVRDERRRADGELSGWIEAASARK